MRECTQNSLSLPIASASSHLVFWVPGQHLSIFSSSQQVHLFCPFLGPLSDCSWVGSLDFHFLLEIKLGFPLKPQEVINLFAEGSTAAEPLGAPKNPPPHRGPEHRGRLRLRRRPGGLRRPHRGRWAEVQRVRAVAGPRGGGCSTKCLGAFFFFGGWGGPAKWWFGYVWLSFLEHAGRWWVWGCRVVGFFFGTRHLKWHL